MEWLIACTLLFFISMQDKRYEGHLKHYFLFQLNCYHKIPVISPGLIFAQKAPLVGLFSEGFIIAGNFAKWLKT